MPSPVSEAAARAAPALFANYVSDGTFELPAHLRLIQKHLLNVFEGKTKRLLISVPPRYGKSLLTSRYFPAWLIGVKPDTKVILASYEAAFAAKWGGEVRNILEEFGPSVFGISVRADTRAKDEWVIDKHGGGMFTSGIGGPLTGRGTTCFVHGTMISTPKGDVRIEDIQVGDEVFGAVVETGEVVIRRVLATNSSMREIGHLTMRRSAANVSCTPDHRLYVPGRGYVEAQDLNRWDRISWLNPGASGSAPVVSTAEVGSFTHIWDKFQVYDIQVEGTQNFFANGLLAHNCLIIDDPFKNSDEANSPAMSERVWDWYRSTARTRLEPGGAIIIIQTRWSERDLTGRLLEEEKNGGEQWEKVVLPAIAEEGDPLGRKVGEPLWPTRFDLATLREIERSVGSYVFGALYQQRPAPLGGGLFKRDWFRYFRELPDGVIEPDEGPRTTIARLRVFGVVDLAISQKTSADYTVLGIFGQDRTGRVFLLDLQRGRFEGPALIPWIRRHAMDKWSCMGIWIEKVQFQALLIQLARKEGLPIRELIPKGDKVARAIPATALMEGGHFFMRRNAPWLEVAEAELLGFPTASHDDVTDVIAYSAHVAASLLTPPILTLPDTYGPRTHNLLDDYSLKDPERRDGSGVGLNEP